MAVEAKLSEKLGLTDPKTGLVEGITSVLTGMGLPTEIPVDLSSAAIIQAMRVDKKKDGNAIKFALPIKIGFVKVGVPVYDLEEVL